MKKLLSITMFVACMVMASFVNTSAQSASAIAMTVKTATYANVIQDTATIKATGAYNVVTIQPVITKLTGTPGGIVWLYGSLDGVNYVRATTDTMTITNQAINTYVFTVSPSKYLYYMVRVISAGTSTCGFKSWFLGRQ